MPRFKQVDVFTKVRYAGNAVAVIYDADDLTTAQMQSIARWTNLSETTFVLRPTSAHASYGLRIFTPTEELPFAGHPTLGTAHALLEDGVIAPVDGKVYQECKAGLVTITVGQDKSGLSFELPYHHFTPILDAARKEIEESLGKKAVGVPVLIETGPKWAVFEFASGQDVLDLNIDFGRIQDISSANGWTGIGVFGKHEVSGLVELRNIAPATGVAEDPACGSGSGAVGAYLSSKHADAGLESVEITQGSPIGRDAKILVKIDESGEELKIHVGGHAITCFEGNYSI
ncbi:Antisense-enhancing sequence 1 [Candida viswanathii]|jgi:PhzF family phenazine biosynthesis protein|uniref:Antisense-enhancing sequence 1 n=1 Tax=Candida viswanathii TaxID=5486 RepID=A0A367XN76_9ASCO|nr:Antisense-enhancing sequence 1 [Candida viswanathii]